MGKTKKSTELQIDTKRIYSYLQAIPLSFFSESLYWDIYKRWRGIGLLYTLLMVSILCIPLTVNTIVEMNRFFNEELIAPFHHLPDIPYVNGKLKFNKKMPYFIKSKEGNIETIIDNTGTITTFVRAKYPGLRFLFIDNKLLYTIPEPSQILKVQNASSKSKISEFDVPEDISFVFNGDEFLKAYQIENLKIAILIAIYPFVLTTFYLVAIIFLLPLAMMGQLVSQAIFKVHLYYKQSCRILFVSYTPAFFVLQIMLISGIYKDYIGLVWLGLLAICFSLAIITLKRKLRSIARI